jgi:Protein of unknown function (DUF1592)/Protein of unknown function (DUF1588)/Protein of unknown function (DUF1585)/Protein of unknown function (DUF1587)/Protein of unknown function (DUF1595)/Cytochrome C oxidase, cbb3-type, subunit III
MARPPFFFELGIVLISAAGGAPMTGQQAGVTIQKYCATCHSAQLHTAGLVLDAAAAGHPQTDAERWEKVIRKLRAQSMPPAGAPRPDQATYRDLQSFLETTIDQAAADHPNPGKLPLHRLTRTEYQNAVRDLLALDAMPQEMDYSMLLPADNSMSGFDNIADLLFVSPTAMESYLGAAEKIARLAVGDPKFPVMVNMYRMPDEEPQNEHMPGLPVGTRGGMAIHTDFPVDGEYVVKVSFLGFSREPQQLEISIDGARVQLAAIAAGFGEKSNRPLPSGDYDPAVLPERKPLEFRIPVHAGPRAVGVSFLERDETRDEEVLKPRWRSTGPDLAVELVTISGPYNGQGSGDTPSRRRIFVCRPAAEQETSCAQKILLAVERRAFRRPVTLADVQPLMIFFAEGKAEGGFDIGIERAIQRLLVSPQFLFRIERDPTGEPGTSRPVSDLELASRLSFFLWSSIPDDELLDLAASGKLRQPGVLDQQVRRMMADSRSATLVSNFAEQWLYLRDLDSKKPNEILFPDFDESLRDAFRKETDLFIDSVLRGNRSVLDLISANYTFLNERLALHYGVPNIHGSWFRRVTFPPDSPRGGLLGQGSLLTITSYANRTSPVNRGKWVLENLLNAAPPPPPPNVPALKTEGSAPGKTLTMREAMVQHRSNPACIGCHARMDPIGFAMENFDAVGRWRDRDGDNPIDTAGVFPAGEKFDGMAGLKKALLSRPEDFVTTVTEKLLMYAVGRNVQYFDEPAVRAIVKAAAKDNYTFSSLVVGVVNSAPFEMRQVAKESNSLAKK